MSCTYVSPEEPFLCIKAEERRLFVSEVLADREELLEVIAHDLQAGKSTGRARLESRIVATERRVKVVDRHHEWCRTVSGTALCDVGRRRLRHEPFLLVPECLQKVVHGSVWIRTNTFSQYPKDTGFSRDLPACMQE
jgi:hypothetical protein